MLRRRRQTRKLRQIVRLLCELDAVYPRRPRRRIARIAAGRL